MVMGWLLVRILAMAALLASSLAASTSSSSDPGTGVDLAGVDLAGVDLAGVDLAGVDLAGVDLAGVDLGGVFGEARASATELTAATMELDLEVEANPEAVVVAHLIEPGGAQETVPLVLRSSGSTNLGRFGIRTEVRKVDFVVVFEVVGETAAQSQPVRITDLGVRPAVLGVLTGSGTEPDEVSPTTQLWGWAGLGLGATALAVLAFWAMPDRRKRAKEDDSSRSPGAGSQIDKLGSPVGEEKSDREAEVEQERPNTPP